MATQQVLRNTSANLEETFFADEAPVDASGAVTVTITRADGSELVSGAPTTSTGTGTGRYRYTLAPQADLNSLTIQWSGTFSGQSQVITSYVDIVGGFYVTLNELRAQPDLSNLTRFTTQKLRDARAWFESTFEDFTGVAWVPRFARERVRGTGTASLLLPHRPVRRVLSVRDYTNAATFTAYSPVEIADLAPLPSETGEVGRTSLAYYAPPNLMFEYEHGFLAPPRDVKEAALTAIRDLLINDAQGNRKYALQTEAGVMRFSTASAERPFGIPFVDAVAARHRATQHVPAIA